MNYAKSISCFSLFLGSLFLPMTAAAQFFDVTPHVSAGTTLADIDNGGLDYKAIQIRGGVDFNRYLGIEAEGAFGVGSRDIGNGNTAKLASQQGIYGVFSLPLGKSFKINSRLGYMSYKRSVNITGFGNSSNNVSGPAISLGAKYFFGDEKKNGVRFDATAFVGVQGDGTSFIEDRFLSLSYIRKF